MGSAEEVVRRDWYARGPGRGRNMFLGVACPRGSKVGAMSTLPQVLMGPTLTMMPGAFGTVNWCLLASKMPERGQDRGLLRRRLWE